MDICREAELKRLIKEQNIDKYTKIIKPTIIDPALLKRQRKEAAIELKLAIKTAKGKRKVKYALVRFLDDIGVPRKGIGEVLKTNVKSIRRIIYALNTSSVKKENAPCDFSNSDEGLK